ncbi:MAG: hypothetical protein GXO77_02240 [Calditrichaeota bacterium]|nr:hypothetical protein [Calditrichota bacterium]
MNGLVYTLLILSLFALFGCQKESNPLQTEFEPPSTETLKKVEIEQFYYDSVQISSSPQFTLSSKSVHLIQLGYVSNGQIFIMEEIKPAYVKSGSRYLLDFKARLGFDKTTLNVKLVVRYLLDDYSFADYDTTIALYKYPYPNAEVYLLYDDFLPDYLAPIQDFDIRGRSFFFHPYGPYGTYEYDLQTSDLRVVYDQYFGGDAICVDSDYVFIDIFHHWIYRFDLRTKSDPVEIYYFGGNGLIRGMEAAEGVLYVLYDKRNLYRLDYDGNLIDTLDYHQKLTTSFGFKDGILYSVGNDYELFRYDVNNQIFLEPKPLPVLRPDAVRIEDDYLYFSHYDKRFIGRVPLEDVLNFTGKIRVEKIPLKSFRKERISRSLNDQFIAN